jgi:glutamyl-tRNA synthetase
VHATSTIAMAGVLTLSAKASPFPFGAVAIAAYTQKAELAFDEDAAAPTLALDGQQISSEEDIIRALAHAAGLADDSSKVCE